MSYRIRLPSGSDAGTLDIVDPSSTTIQRVLRHRGLAGYEPPTMSTLLALFELQADGFTFFDIGANMGLYAATCASLFAPGAVHAFEPAPGTASVARKIARANRLRIQVFEVALSDGDGVAQLHLSEKSDSSHSLVAGFKRSSGSVDVRTCRLDRHVDRGGRGAGCDEDRCRDVRTAGHRRRDGDDRTTSPDHRDRGAPPTGTRPR